MTTKVNVWDYFIECDQVVEGILPEPYARYFRQLRPDGSYVLCGDGISTQKNLVVL